jgi:hypothetical protein
VSASTAMANVANLPLDPWINIVLSLLSPSGDQEKNTAPMIDAAFSFCR